MPTLLFEIGCEELPASACDEANVQLPDLCRRHLNAAPSDLYLGPRRLGVLVPNLPDRTPDEWVKGPPLSVAYDDDRKPTKAAEGFARRQGVAVDELEERDGTVGVVVPGKDLREVLPARLAEIVRGLAFAKSMWWNGDGLRFSRPIRWLCAKLDGETVAVEVGDIPAGGFSYGHRFTAGRVEIASAEAYRETLLAAGVEPDRACRWRDICAALDELGPWSDPGDVLSEVVYLVESPIVLEGRFDERFLQLPSRVATTAMQAHQRYFPLGGNRFAFVANGGDPDVVRAGNEQVLENRLDDAAFTFERDVAKGIDGLAQELGAITFIAGGGSFADKTERLVKLVERLGGGDASLEAARLAKADEAAELVREFPDLEGHIGAEYARLAGYPEAVSAAIEEHYLPEAAGGPLPATEAGKILAAADRIDNLTVAFSLGHKPTGSRDPFGLRRAAIGLDRLALEGGLAIAREDLGEARDFVEERFEGLLDVPVEFVRAARQSAATELRGVAELALALAALPDERLGPIHTAYTRASRIAADTQPGPVDPALLTEPAERAVLEAVGKAEPEIREALVRHAYEEALDAGAELGPPLAQFFDDVLVMAEDAAVRENRLRLLLEVRDALGLLGDFSEIPR
ncbi:MAG: glycine--tRNA ligase subunit beta [Actinomycetota bacterium]|nr:glycine--tRNA ligase subunit beta [Actinomycetota bacterium]